MLLDSFTSLLVRSAPSYSFYRLIVQVVALLQLLRNLCSPLVVIEYDCALFLLSKDCDFAQKRYPKLLCPRSFVAFFSIVSSFPSLGSSSLHQPVIAAPKLAQPLDILLNTYMGA